jgi:hypothetical protein
MVGDIMVNKNGRRIKITKVYKNIFDVLIYEFEDVDNPPKKRDEKNIFKNILNSKTIKEYTLI